MFVFFCCFFQAEDGIRDLVRSRGLGDVYKRQHYDRLIDLNVALIRYIAGQAGMKTTFRFTSEMQLNETISAEDKILAILRKLEGTVYVSGSGAGSKRYIDEERFSLENIKIEWQHFSCPVYPQLWGPFIPDLSIIDLLFNCGDKTPEILRSC